MRKGKCKTRDFCMFNFRTIGGYSADLWFGANTKFEFKEQEDGTYLLMRKGVTLTIPEVDFNKMIILSEV